MEDYDSAILQLKEFAKMICEYGYDPVFEKYFKQYNKKRDFPYQKWDVCDVIDKLLGFIWEFDDKDFISKLIVQMRLHEEIIFVYIWNTYYFREFEHTE